MELENQDQLAEYQIHLRKKNTGKWKAFIPNCGIPFEPDATGEGNTVIEAIQALTIKLAQVPNPAH